ENIIHRAIVLTEGDEIKPEVIGFDLSASQQTTITKYFDLPIREFNDACERDYLVTQLNKHNWHIINTAKAIGIDRSNLTLKMKRYGITNHR
ncbi:MAG TPA: helix-turn-helix domain-containing protein, partial [bacterium]